MKTLLLLFLSCLLLVGAASSARATKWSEDNLRQPRSRTTSQRQEDVAMQKQRLLFDTHFLDNRDLFRALLRQNGYKYARLLDLLAVDLFDLADGYDAPLIEAHLDAFDAADTTERDWAFLAALVEEHATYRLVHCEMFELVRDFIHLRLFEITTPLPDAQWSIAPPPRGQKRKFSRMFS